VNKKKQKNFVRLEQQTPSSAQRWGGIELAVGWERALSQKMAARATTAALYEFLRFGMKEAWACLFGGIMVALMLGTHWFYPRHAVLARYDFIFLAAVLVQILLLRFRLETWEEAKIIAIYHVIGTLMEIFKTSVGSWIYPEHAFFHIAGVPLFSGFMYASIGSYVARSWRLFEFRFAHHPPLWALGILSAATYLNFFTHHFIMDMRWALFAVTAILLGKTKLYYRVWRSYRSMPLLLGLGLVALFIWFAENIGTFTAVWLYPHQMAGWTMVRLGKLGAWFLLLIISYTLVAAVNKPLEIEEPALPSATQQDFVDQEA